MKRRDFVRLPLTLALTAAVRNGRLRQSVTRWPFQAIPLRDFCRAVADIGLTAVDLLEEADWPVAREFGLACSMGYAGGGSIKDGLNVVDHSPGGRARRDERDYLFREPTRDG
jgi:hypothetical protein